MERATVWACLSKKDVATSDGLERRADQDRLFSLGEVNLDWVVSLFLFECFLAWKFQGGISGVHELCYFVWNYNPPILDTMPVPCQVRIVIPVPWRSITLIRILIIGCND